MNRRRFLSMLGLGAAIAFDPERLLWLPGKKTIFIPPAPEITYELVLRTYEEAMLSVFRRANSWAVEGYA